eukprot:SAG22_NODE_51_length_24458_cov_19.853161_3_plen_410_part_00
MGRIPPAAARLGPGGAKPHHLPAHELHSAYPEDCDDRDVVLRAVTAAGGNLQYASAELRADKAVVLAAAASDELALLWASDELQDDPEFVAAVDRAHAAACAALAGEKLSSGINNAGHLHEHGLLAAAADCADRASVLAAVARCGSDLQYASAELRADKEVVLAAAAQDGTALLWASEELQDDPDVVEAAEKAHAAAAAQAAGDSRVAGSTAVLLHEDGHGLNSAQHHAACADRAQVLAAVRHSGAALQYASAELRGDKAVVLAAAANDDLALLWASEELQDDPGFVAAIEKAHSRARPGLELQGHTAAAAGSAAAAAAAAAQAQPATGGAGALADAAPDTAAPASQTRAPALPSRRAPSARENSSAEAALKTACSVGAKRAAAKSGHRRVTVIKPGSAACCAQPTKAP